MMRHIRKHYFLLILLFIISCNNTPSRNKQVVGQDASGKIDTVISKQDRMDVLNVLQQLVKKEIGSEVKFVVQTMQRGNNWVLIQVQPVHLDGSNIDYTKSLYYQDTNKRERIDNGFFDDHVLALLEQKNDVWDIIEYEIGATDYSGQYWLEKHKISKFFK